MIKILLSCILTIMLLVSSCSCSMDSTKSFFAWMDSYIAMPEESEWTISLTIFSESGNINSLANDIVDLEFDGIANSIPINTYSFSYMTSYDTLAAFSFEISFSSTEQGVYHTNSLVFTRGDNTKFSYSIGECIFDVGEAPSNIEVLDVYSSPAVTANSDYFLYSYKPTSDIVQIEEIKYTNTTTDFDNLVYNYAGKLKINSEAPIKYIRSKIFVDYLSNTEIYYAVGCYCGALDFDDIDMAKSKEHSEYKELIF